MRKFNSTYEMYETLAKEDGITLMNALSCVKDVSAEYFESVTSIKAHKPVMFYIPNYGYVGESDQAVS